MFYRYFRVAEPRLVVHDTDFVRIVHSTNQIFASLTVVYPGERGSGAERPVDVKLAVVV